MNRTRLTRPDVITMNTAFEAFAGGGLPRPGQAVSLETAWGTITRGVVLERAKTRIPGAPEREVAVLQLDDGTIGTCTGLAHASQLGWHVAH